MTNGPFSISVIDYAKDVACLGWRQSLEGEI